MTMVRVRQVDLEKFCSFLCAVTPFCDEKMLDDDDDPPLQSNASSEDGRM